VNSAVTRISSAKPSLPSGSLVLMMPTALSEMTPWKVSSSAPKYSPLAGSSPRKPPPVTGPALTRSPTPLGGLKPMSSWTGPRLPWFCGGNERVAVTPIFWTTASIGPSRARMSAPTLSGICPPCSPPAIVRPSIETGPSSMCAGKRISSALEPLK